MNVNYEKEIQIFYHIIIKPQLPPDTGLYQTMQKPKMNAMYNQITDKIHFFVEYPRNPIYAIDKFYYDCGEYSLHDILKIVYIYDTVKITMTKGEQSC